MILGIYAIVVSVLCIGLICYSISTKNSAEVLSEVYDALKIRHDATVKSLDIARRENKILQEENAKLNEELPKTEKIKKTTTRKTTTPRKTTTKKSSK